LILVFTPLPLLPRLCLLLFVHIRAFGTTTVVLRCFVLEFYILHLVFGCHSCYGELGSFCCSVDLVYHVAFTTFLPLVHSRCIYYRLRMRWFLVVAFVVAVVALLTVCSTFRFPFPLFTIAVLLFTDCCSHMVPLRLHSHVTLVYVTWLRSLRRYRCLRCSVVTRSSLIRSDSLLLVVRSGSLLVPWFVTVAILVLVVLICLGYHSAVV